MWRGSEREENTLKGKRKGRRTLRFLLDTLFDEKKDGLIYASSGYDRTKVVVGILGVRKWMCMTLHRMEGIKKKLLYITRPYLFKIFSLIYLMDIIIIFFFWKALYSQCYLLYIL